MASQLEGRAFALLRGQIPRFYVPSLDERKQVLSWLGMSSKFVRSFDALQLDVDSGRLAIHAFARKLLNNRVTNLGPCSGTA